jgi:hypothetical protein
VVIVGEAGIGKTRLAEELCTQAVLAGARVERVAMQAHDVHRPMATFADLVPKLLELPGALGCSPDSMAALSRLMKPDAAKADAMSSEAIAVAIAQALADLVDSIASESPLLIFLDDGQWADEGSRQTLATLAASRRSRRLTIVVTSRTREMAQFFAQRSERALSLTLAPLSSACSLELTNRLLAQRVSAEFALRDWIATSSGGNPFFLKCLLDHYEHTGERFVVPSSISALLDQKLAALSQTAGALLGTCVALGRHSNVERLQHTLELRPIEFQLALSDLEAAYLIAQVEGKIEPTHSLVAEAILRLTSPIALRAMYRRVATVLEAEAHATDSSTLLWDCTEQWILAGEPQHAIDFLRRCASQALEIGRPREAAALLLRGSSFAVGQESTKLAREAVSAARTGREPDLVRQVVGRLRELGVCIEGDEVELDELLATVADWNESLSLIERLRWWLTSGAPVEQRIRAAITLLIVGEVQSQPELGPIVYDGLLRGLDASGDELDAHALTALLIYHCVFGDMRRVENLVGRLLIRASEVPAVAATDLYRKCAVALWRIGFVDQAIDTLMRWYTTAKAAGLLRSQFDAVMTLISYLDDALSDEVHRWLEIADTMIAQDRDLERSPAYVVLRLDIACQMGDLPSAQKWRDMALLLQEESEHPRMRRWLRAADLRIRQLEGDLPSVVEAQGLVEHHKVNFEVGDVGDFEFGVCLWTVCAHGEMDLARQISENYFRVCRRSLNPPNRIIFRALVPSDRDSEPSEWLQDVIPARSTRDAGAESSMTEARGPRVPAI